MADENDDDVCDSWEDMLDSDIFEEKLRRMKPDVQAEDDRPIICSNRGSYMGPVIVEDDVARTPYSPPEPQVKILKRPSASIKQDNGTPIVNGERSSKQPVKTLQQREAEYAEARLRILGSAKSEEEIAEERLAKLGISQPPEIAIRGIQIALPQEMSCIIRQPHGPDGTTGFTLKR